MKVFDLQCVHGHAFEGWFASEDDFQGQNAKQLVECPFCGNAQISKLPSAPRLNLNHTQSETANRHQLTANNTPALPQGNASHLPAQAMHTLWLKVVDHVMANTEDVGANFAEEARRIHYGETQERGIRGQATAQEAQALNDEGIEVMALPVPARVKGTIQ